MSGFVQLLKINELVRDGTLEQRLRTAVPAHQKTHSSDTAIRKQRAFDRQVQPWAKFMRVGSRLAKKVASKNALLPAMSPVALETGAVHSR